MTVLQSMQQKETRWNITARSIDRHRLFGVGLPLLIAAMLLGCRDLTGSQSLPSGTSNPSSYNTVAGALGQRNAAVKAFIDMLPSYITDTGLLSDEFVAPPCSGCGNRDPVDSRSLPASSPTNTISYATDGDYAALNQVRGLANQAIGQLAKYDQSASPALRGELYALEGYAEVFLADLFCSGIPLSTLDYQHDYTYRAGSPRDSVYADAIAKFDTALSLSRDSARILNLAAVGKGRALLDLGQYTEAAQAVANVPDQFQYQIQMDAQLSDYGSQPLVVPEFQGTVADREGGNGLPFISSSDPRTTSHANGYGCGSECSLIPDKIANLLNGAGFAPVIVADGIEARLIQAEGALQAGDPMLWLQLLNHLRDSAVVQATGEPEPEQLLPFTMPATDTARVSLMFAERAYWLFATGHRQGDLRRFIRQYGALGFNQATVYPVGITSTGGFYGSDVTAPIPGAEYTNPLFHGCLDRHA